jgi:hypothetical protein
VDSFKRIANLKEIQKLVAALMVKVDKKYVPSLKSKSNSKNTANKKIKSL